jgi:hypothetical protein
MLLEHAMLITEEMLQAGVAKAVELALLPRKSVSEDIATNKELMLEILECVLDAPEQIPPRSTSTRSSVSATA